MKYSFYRDPHHLLVFDILSCGLYGTQCTVYGVQGYICTNCSLFVWLSKVAKPEQNLSLNEISETKLSTYKVQISNTLLIVSFSSHCLSQTNQKSFGILFLLLLYLTLTKKYLTEVISSLTVNLHFKALLTIKQISILKIDADSY